jgi:Glycosyltransferase family 87
VSMGDWPVMLTRGATADGPGARVTARWSWQRWAFVGGLAPLVGVYVYVGWHAIAMAGRGQFSDFAHFYYASRAMRENLDIYSSWQHGYLYPPLWAFLIQPLAGLSITTAAKIQVMLNCAAALAALLLASWEAQRRLCGRVEWWRVTTGAILVVLILSGPLRSDIEMGQTNAWTLLGVVVALCLLDRFPPGVGLALAFAYNIKFHTVIFLPYLLVRRRWACAAWFVAFGAALSLLPSLSTGWSTNLHYLGVSYSGVLDLFGISTPLHVAARSPLDVGFSISIPSMLARMFGGSGDRLALELSLVLLVAGVIVAATFYRLRRVPLLMWPAAPAAHAQPWRSMSCVEWAGLAIVVLAFSPQSNSRHFVLAVLGASVAAAMLFSTGRPRAWAGLALLTLLLGMNLPPGSDRTRAAEEWWRAVSGHSWTILLAYAMMLWAVLSHVSARASEHASSDARSRRHERANTAIASARDESSSSSEQSTRGAPA